MPGRRMAACSRPQWRIVYRLLEAARADVRVVHVLAVTARRFQAASATVPPPAREPRRRAERSPFARPAPGSQGPPLIHRSRAPPMVDRPATRWITGAAATDRPDLPAMHTSSLESASRGSLAGAREAWLADVLRTSGRFCSCGAEPVAGRRFAVVPAQTAAASRHTSTPIEISAARRRTPQDLRTPPDSSDNQSWKR